MIRARCCPGRRGSDDGRPPGGGDGKPEFERSFIQQVFGTHLLGHSAVFTRPVEEASLEKRMGILQESGM